MPSVTLISHTGHAVTLQASSGRSLMQVASAGGVDGIAADCGGSLSCATCHVYVDEAWAERLPAAQDDELAMLEMTAAERRSTSRLSCQIVIDDSLHGLRVQLPEHQY